MTQSTIAKIHGVSRQAVGSALGLYTNTNIKLNPATRDKIRRTAEELGYRPNRLAQIISGRRSGTLGVMNFGGIGQMSAQHAFSVAKAIQDAGYGLMLYDVSWYQEGGIETVVNALLDHKVEGILLVSPTDWMPADALGLAHASRTPCVAINGVSLPDCAHIESDFEGDTRRLVEGLLDRGYERPAFLLSWSSFHNVETRSGPRYKRLRGFISGIESRGGTVHEAPPPPDASKPCGEIFHAPAQGDWSDPYLPGENAMRQILARRTLPDVVCCGNDDWAIGALKACRTAGIRVPEDISITGNDGTVMSGYGYIPITTIIQPVERIAKAAVEMLRQMIGMDGRRDEAVVAGDIAWRASTR